MSKASDEFEKKIARIYTVLEQANSKVTWNDRVPDPDNPSQLRQIDISIVNELSTTYVECRIHSAKQDVKWIEELYGRKESLGADFIIAVSSSGFTSGAIKKAVRFGIELRDTIELKDEDISSWGNFTSMSYEYFVYDSFDVTLVMPSQEAVADINNDIEDSMSNYPNFRKDIVAGLPIKQMREKYMLDGSFSLERNFKWEKPTYIKGHEVSFMRCEIKNISLIKEYVTFKRAVTFGDAFTDVRDRETSIQEFANKDGNFIRHGDRIILHSVNPGYHIPDDSILCQINAEFTNHTPMQFTFSYEISEVDKENRRSTIRVGVAWGTWTV